MDVNLHLKLYYVIMASLKEDLIELPGMDELIVSAKNFQFEMYDIKL